MVPHVLRRRTSVRVQLPRGRCCGWHIARAGSWCADTERSVSAAEVRLLTRDAAFVEDAADECA
jgi:hypothetical protein